MGGEPGGNPNVKPNKVRTLCLSVCDRMPSNRKARKKKFTRRQFCHIAGTAQCSVLSVEIRMRTKKKKVHLAVLLYFVKTKNPLIEHWF